MEQTDADGNRRHAANLCMNGADVFSFTLREVPPAVTAVMRLAGYEPKQVDALHLHQANAFMVKTLGKKMGFTDEQTPSDVFADYGNQSSASIPATLVHTLGGRLEAETLKLAGCGFGVGLSWGAFAGEIGPITVCPIQSFPR